MVCSALAGGVPSIAAVASGIPFDGASGPSGRSAMEFVMELPAVWDIVLIGENIDGLWV